MHTQFHLAAMHLQDSIHKGSHNGGPEMAAQCLEQVLA